MRAKKRMGLVPEVTLVHHTLSSREVFTLMSIESGLSRTQILFLPDSEGPLAAQTRVNDDSFGQ